MPPSTHASRPLALYSRRLNQDVRQPGALTLARRYVTEDGDHVEVVMLFNKRPGPEALDGENEYFVDFPFAQSDLLRDHARREAAGKRISPRFHHLGMRLAGAVVALVLMASLAGCFGGPGATEEPPVDSGGANRVEPFPSGAIVGDTRLFTRVGEPGSPEGVVIDGDRLYVSSAGFDIPATVFEHSLATGELQRTITFEPPAEVRGDARGAIGLAVDGHGRIYAAEAMGGRIVRFDPHAEELDQVTYAEIPDLPPCTTNPTEPCAPTREPRHPLPNYPAFGPDGSLYVTDSYQHTIWRIQPGGGQPDAWFQDPRFETAHFGMNGLAFGPQDDHLYVAQSVIGPGLAGEIAPVGSAVWRLPLTDAPAPGDLELFYSYTGVLIDGITFGASGNLYVTVLGIAPNGVTISDPGISILTPDGEEQYRFPAPGQDQAQEVPYRGPASIAFHDAHRSILVTNLANPSEPDNWAVLEAFVDDVGHPLHRPEVA